MPFPRRTRSLGIATASAVIAVVSSCVAPRQRSRHADAPGCEFIVYNRTPHALEVRLGVRRLSSSPIGALNPGELLPTPYRARYGASGSEGSQYRLRWGSQQHSAS